MTAAATNRPAEGGFSLIEALIALAVLAITAVSFLRAIEANVARVGALESRLAAGWVAENRLSELSLGLAAADAPVAMLGSTFVVKVTPQPTTDPNLLRVDIDVTALQATGGASITGFIWRLTGFGL